jgi:hypothetical protein
MRRPRGSPTVLEVCMVLLLVLTPSYADLRTRDTYPRGYGLFNQVRDGLSI